MITYYSYVKTRNFSDLLYQRIWIEINLQNMNSDQKFLRLTFKHKAHSCYEMNEEVSKFRLKIYFKSNCQVVKTYVFDV